MIAGPVHLLRKRCTMSGIKKYLEHRDCINATKSLMDVCNDDVIGDTQKILKAKKDNWIPLSCCFISKSNQCSTNVIKGEPKCDDKSSSYMMEAINQFAGEVFDLFCGNGLMWQSDACQKVIKQIPLNETIVSNEKSNGSYRKQSGNDTDEEVNGETNTNLNDHKYVSLLFLNEIKELN
ncbi:Calcitonin gene-related peptide type 1 receptor [Sarcoptes scabiei]|nr:Calcitonin gene-related peptide type 1 receptor [Sarcoptes scabiei]